MLAHVVRGQGRAQARVAVPHRQAPSLTSVTIQRSPFFTQSVPLTPSRRSLRRVITRGASDELARSPSGLRLAEAAAIRVEDPSSRRDWFSPSLQWLDEPLKSDMSRTPIPIPKRWRPSSPTRSSSVTGRFLASDQWGNPAGPWTIERAVRACPHVGSGAGLGHRQAVDLLASDARVEVAPPLLFGAGQQDVGRSRHPGVLQYVACSAELLFVEHPRHRVEAGPADLLGHVRGNEPGGQCLGADLSSELGPQHPGALDEGACPVHDAALLVGQAEAMR